ncbi:unnamed protein product [Dracunculus medinensis]|uniref:USP domain-containing protein n=1 Tax=Dracunculus medinensis TaxID=318479 RepID=A0A0N4UK28_DRAME|nr:unnamed protein product [Dracunculus medinensis]
MTILSVAGSKGRVQAGGDLFDQANSSSNVFLSFYFNSSFLIFKVGILTANEAELFNSVKRWLGDVNERILIHVIKNHSTSVQSQFGGNSESLMNDIIGSYFDKIQPDAERSFKQVRFDENSKNSPQNASLKRPSSFTSCGTSTDKAVVVDLTLEEDRGSLKWKNSMTNNVIGSREEQDVIKAIEESLKENQNVPGFSPFAQKDAENPHERKRIDLMPVGLKNIGNSCWFNVIAQTLFHLPRFRQLLFEFTAKEFWDEGDGFTERPSSSKEVTPSDLLFAFRGLSAMLLASTRAYVDPTDILQTINDLNTNLNKTVPCIGIQQDAIEMLLRLIEWLEQAFNACDIANCAPLDAEMEEVSCFKAKEESNAVDEITDDGANAPTTSCVLRPFNSLLHGSHIELRQFPAMLKSIFMILDGVITRSVLENSLQMINLDVSFDNLHDSLEAYHFNDYPSKEVIIFHFFYKLLLFFLNVWFENLPPVIIFSLVRFSYKNGQTEKLHSKFHFPLDFFMDRYLHRNRTYVNIKRQERMILKERLENLKNELRRLCFIHCIKFSRRTLLPSWGISAFGFENNEGSGHMEDHSNEFKPAISKELVVLDADAVARFLLQISNDVNAKIIGLQDEVNSLQENIDATFNVENMKEEGYRLHSVIIHEGEANVGHYWAYIADHSTLDENGSPVNWRRFNDKSVERATWQQIEEDSFGSRRTCSAYCLIYTRKRLEQELFGQGGNTASSTIPHLLDTLPIDLKQLVAADNDKFNKELESWDSKILPIECGPINRPVLRLPVDSEIADMLGVSKPLDLMNISRRHCECAFHYFGNAMLQSALKMLYDKTLDNVDDAKMIFNELLNNHICHINRAIELFAKTSNMDRLLILTEWARLFGFSMSKEAEKLFIVQVLSKLDEPNLQSLCKAYKSERGLAGNNNPVIDELDVCLFLCGLFIMTYCKAGVYVQLFAKISQDILHSISASNEKIVVEYDNFLRTEYRAMLSRLRCYKGEAYEQVVVNGCSKSNLSEMPFIHCDIKDVSVAKDLISLKQYMMKVNLNTVDDLLITVSMLIKQESVTPS